MTGLYSEIWAMINWKLTQICLRKIQTTLIITKLHFSQRYLLNKTANITNRYSKPGLAQIQSIASLVNPYRKSMAFLNMAFQMCILWINWWRIISHLSHWSKIIGYWWNKGSYSKTMWRLGRWIRYQAKNPITPPNKIQSTKASSTHTARTWWG